MVSCFGSVGIGCMGETYKTVQLMKHRYHVCRPVGEVVDGDCERLAQVVSIGILDLGVASAVYARAECVSCAFGH